MRLYHNKPRRPKPQATAKKNEAQKQRVQAANAAGALIGLLILLAWIRLSIAVASTGSAALVGDRVPLGPAQLGPPDHIIAARTLSDPFSKPGISCSLDVNEMSKPGGILTVMAVRADGVMLSWAGGATSAAADCHRLGKTVLISADNYESLVKPQFPKH